MTNFCETPDVDGGGPVGGRFRVLRGALVVALLFMAVSMFLTRAWEAWGRLMV